ncbi:MAG: hypothetical protein IAG13_28800 [Deltaproteobacteria bacterium]|nr:hypothetical protein [Nannocystaceae bacterium]
MCSVTSESVINLCIPFCDPLADDCPHGTDCHPAGDAFTCSTDLSGPVGSYGDPCEFLDVCDPGLFCAARSAVPDCGGPTGCCSEYCDLDADDPDASCDGAAQGQVCVPWFEEGMAPPAFARVGACSLPQ